MQIVIDIPEEMYQKIKETSMIISGRRSGKRFDYILFNAVNTGTPLPKGHGDLIDRNEVCRLEEELCVTECGCCGLDGCFYDRAKTIIEADSEGEE